MSLFGSQRLRRLARGIASTRSRFVLVLVWLALGAAWLTVGWTERGEPTAEDSD